MSGVIENEDAQEVQWLDEQEKAAWTGLISLVLLLPGKLESPLRQEHGLTLFEYLVLSHLSEAPQRKLRMGELAFLASGSLSRLSNVVKRCEQRGGSCGYPTRPTAATLSPNSPTPASTSCTRPRPHTCAPYADRPRLTQHGRSEGPRPHRGKATHRP